MVKHILFSIAIFCILLCGQIEARIAIYGDTRTQDDIHQAVINKIAAHKPNIAFHTGDLVNSGTNQAEYDKFHHISKPLTEVAILVPAKGNHEKRLDIFLSNFPQMMGRSFFTVEYDTLVFIVLDTTQRISIGSEQYQWLTDQLEEYTGRTIFIIQHHPIFSSGRHGDELGLNLYMPQLLTRYGVKAVFAGHDHCYERSYYNGVYYITTGGGGAPLYDQSSANRHSQLFIKTHHYIIADRDADAIFFQVYDLEDKLIDSFKIPAKEQP